MKEKRKKIRDAKTRTIADGKPEGENSKKQRKVTEDKRFSRKEKDRFLRKEKRCRARGKKLNILKISISQKFVHHENISDCTLEVEQSMQLMHKKI